MRQERGKPKFASSEVGSLKPSGSDLLFTILTHSISKAELETFNI